MTRGNLLFTFFVLTSFDVKTDGWAWCLVVAKGTLCINQMLNVRRKLGAASYASRNKEKGRSESEG